MITSTNQTTMSRLIRKLVLFTGVVLAAMVLTPPEASAQSDILLRLRSGSPLGDRVRVDSAGGIVAMGTLGIGIIPATGAGERMMWYPFKGSFRAGSIAAAGTQWDDANTGFYSAAFGHSTMAKGNFSFATGEAASATATYSIAMGNLANATGTSAIAIGDHTTADANYAVAIGQRASANGKTGAIVFADGSSTDSLQASANNQFSVRAAGGYRLYTNSTMTVGLQMAAGGSSWTVISDRNMKENFRTLNGEDVLRKLRSIPVTSWQYKTEENRTTRHIGPMAQDFQKAFKLTTDNHGINMSDLDGVNLAAIKALEARTVKLQKDLDAKDKLIRDLAARIAALEAKK